MEKKNTIMRCKKCNNKLGLIYHKCKCGGNYCMNDRYADKHDCSYDYKTENKTKLTKENPVITGDKIIMI